MAWRVVRSMSAGPFLQRSLQYIISELLIKSREYETCVDVLFYPAAM